MPPRKRSETEITKLPEPHFSEAQAREFAEGVRLFNEGRYWHAHEAFEQAWKVMTNAPEDDAEIVLRGLVQLAAGLHCLTERRERCAVQNFQKATGKLQLGAPRFLNLNISPVLDFLEDFKQHGNLDARLVLSFV